jgi:hypothetical protein
MREGLMSVSVPVQHSLKARYERLALLCRQRAAESDNLALADGLSVMANAYDRRGLPGR